MIGNEDLPDYDGGEELEVPIDESDSDDDIDWDSHDPLLLIELQYQQDQLDLKYTGPLDRFLKDSSELEKDLAQEELLNDQFTPLQLTLGEPSIPISNKEALAELFKNDHLGETPISKQNQDNSSLTRKMELGWFLNLLQLITKEALMITCYTCGSTFTAEQDLNIPLTVCNKKG